MNKNGFAIFFLVAGFSFVLIMFYSSCKVQQTIAPEFEAIELTTRIQILDSGEWKNFFEKVFILAENDSFTILQMPVENNITKTRVNKETGEEEQFNEKGIGWNRYFIFRLKDTIGYMLDSGLNKGEPVILNKETFMNSNTVTSFDNAFKNAKLKLHFLRTESEGHLLRNYFVAVDSAGNLSNDTMMYEYEVEKKQKLNFEFSKLLDTIPGATFKQYAQILHGRPEQVGTFIQKDRKFILSFKKVPSEKLDDVSEELGKVRALETKKSH